MRLLMILFCSFLTLNYSNALVLEDLIAEGTLAETLQDKKLGYYPGSFDPLHNGHVGTAQLLLDEKICDYVLVMPAWGGDNLKNRQPVEIRQEMLFKTFQDHPQIIVTKLCPQDLQKALTAHGVGEKKVTPLFDMEVFGIIGSDVLQTFKDERKAKAMFSGLIVEDKHARDTVGGIIALPAQEIILVGRAYQEIVDTDLERSPVPIKHILIVENFPNLPVFQGFSSTKVRKVIQAGADYRDMVPAGVYEVIESHRLYRKGKH